jgi:hypothetical protein
MVAVVENRRGRLEAGLAVAKVGVQVGVKVEVKVGVEAMGRAVARVVAKVEVGAVDWVEAWAGVGVTVEAEEGWEGAHRKHGAVLW